MRRRHLYANENNKENISWSRRGTAPCFLARLLSNGCCLILLFVLRGELILRKHVMRYGIVLLTTVALAFSHNSSIAAEGSSIAGPVGGNDIRAAMLPPPGVYGGVVFYHAKARGFYDGSGAAVQALSALDLTRNRAGPFLLFVPDVELFGGSIGVAGFFPAGTECGRLFETTAKRCTEGVGDLYIEAGWSRFFGTIRPSKFPGAYPISEGLTVSLGVGVVVPTGRYDAADAGSHGLTIGNNVWDIAPAAAVTYVTKPFLADGTELSAKIYWNNYLTNPDTGYSTGSIVNIDFAVSERIGKLQVGVAGVYAFQVTDDTLFGARIEPDGRRGEALALGGVLAYDIPEFQTSLKIKALATVRQRHSVRSRAIAVGWFRKF